MFLFRTLLGTVSTRLFAHPLPRVFVALALAFALALCALQGAALHSASEAKGLLKRITTAPNQGQAVNTTAMASGMAMADELHTALAGSLPSNAYSSSTPTPASSSSTKPLAASSPISLSILPTISKFELSFSTISSGFPIRHSISHFDDRWHGHGLHMVKLASPVIQKGSLFRRPSPLLHSPPHAAFRTVLASPGGLKALDASRGARGHRSVDDWGDMDGTLEGFPSNASGQGGSHSERNEMLFEVEGVKDGQGRTLVVTEACAEAMAKPLLYISRLYIEALSLLFYELWILMLCLSSVWAASTPHLVAVVVARAAGLGFGIYQPTQTASLRRQFQSIASAACSVSGTRLPGFWESAVGFEVAFAVIEGVALVLTAGLGWRVAKSIWLDTLISNPWPSSWRSQYSGLLSLGYKIFLGIITGLLAPLLVLGWWAERTRSWKWMAVFEVGVAAVAGHAVFLLTQGIWTATLVSFKFLLFLSTMAIVVLAGTFFVGARSLVEFTGARKTPYRKNHSAVETSFPTDVGSAETGCSQDEGLSLPPKQPSSSRRNHRRASLSSSTALSPTFSTFSFFHRSPRTRRSSPATEGATTVLEISLRTVTRPLNAVQRAASPLPLPLPPPTKYQQPVRVGLDLGLEQQRRPSVAKAAQLGLRVDTGPSEVSVYGAIENVVPVQEERSPSSGEAEEVGGWERERERPLQGFGGAA
ncbi:hypothetical protein JCM5296_003637 [Sporobolomyces johnsonii]